MSARILHVITGLEVGGAELALWRLLGAIDRDRWESRVISITRDGPVGDRLRASGIPVEVVPLKPNLLRWFGLVRRIRALSPHVVQTWLYHADVLGGLAARRAGVPRILWSVRHADLDPATNERSLGWLVRRAARLSHRLPERILFNSETARVNHVAAGYDAGRSVVIPNGFDIQRFKPDPAARAAVRAELGCTETTPLVGLVARFHPQKDHGNFLDAATRVAAAVPEAGFVLCGRDAGPDNSALVSRVTDAGLSGRARLLGVRDDVERVQAALDVAVSSSVGESFPNAIGEAMASGVPCAVTDTGDSARLVGDAGRVVPPRDPAALAGAILELLALTPAERRDLGASARRRIETHYALPAIAARYESLWAGLEP